MLLKDLLKSMPEEKFPLYCEFTGQDRDKWQVIVTNVAGSRLFGVSWICDGSSGHHYEELVTNNQQHIDFLDTFEALHWESLNEVGTPIASDSCICIGPPMRCCPTHGKE